MKLLFPTGSLSSRTTLVQLSSSEQLFPLVVSHTTHGLIFEHDVRHGYEEEKS